MNERELLMSFLTKIFARTDDEVAPLIYNGDEIKTDALEQLVNLDSSRIARMKKSVSTELFDNGHKKGMKDAMEKFESDFREKTGFSSDKIGLDLVFDWGESVKNTNFSEDNLKTHPTFLALEKTWRDKYDKDISQVKGEFDAFKSQVDSEKRFSTIKSKAREHFIGLNPILSEDPSKAERQINSFLNQLHGYNFQEQDGITLITKDGHRIEDQHGNPIQFDTFIAREAEQLFDFRQQQDKGNAGNRYTPQGTFNVPKTEEEYNKAIQAESDPKKRVDIQTAYYKSIGKEIKVV